VLSDHDADAGAAESSNWKDLLLKRALQRVDRYQLGRNTVTISREAMSPTAKKLSPK
jgi:hypothetical protein